MGEATQSGGHTMPFQENEPQKCFIAHSYEVEWHDTIEGVCNDLLPEYGLQPWYAEHHYDPTTTLRDKVVTMIDNARYGIYDISYWRTNEHSPWSMPCNVFIELGIAIALNRPIILLRHTENRIARIELPRSIQSITYISEFTGGDYSLEKALREHLSRLANLPTDYDWQHYRCLFGEIDCSYLRVYPHTTMIGQDKIHCHIADGPDTDQTDFRHTVEKVLDHFNNISYSYLDKGTVPSGYTFLLCRHCQLIRSTPFAIYRITPNSSPDVYIAIGISIGLEYRFRYKIPRFLITKDMQYVPSLLQGYEFVLMKNLHTLKRRLPQFVQHIMTKIDEPAYWKPQELPFEIHNPSGISHEDPMEKTTQKAMREEKPVNIFICYAREDRESLQELERHLVILRRQNLIDLWHDMMINAGEEWEKEINTHLNAAQIILLLVSPDFMGSSYAYGIEMRKAMERAERGEAHVVPIILRPVAWQNTPFGHLKALPRDGRAVSERRGKERTFVEIVAEIRRVVEELRGTS